MQFKHKVFTPTLFFCYMGLFALYLFTAFFAVIDAMDERGGDAFGKACYLVNDYVFFLQGYVFDLGLDKVIGPLPALLVMVFVMSLIYTYLIKFVESLVKNRKDSLKNS